ncbi:thiolase family protein [Candidatus Woesearchaeota archaeon]|nr:thiolase family protein [Candidatus Woesearchaeota archaeon]
MDQVFIDGVAQSNFGKDARELETIMGEVGREALDLSITSSTPDIVVIGNFNAQGYSKKGSLDALVGNNLGIPTTTNVIHVNRGSSTGAAAVQLGYQLALGGNKVLVISGEVMHQESIDRDTVTKETSKVVHEDDRNLGVTMPVIAGLATTEYLHRWSIKEKKLQEIFFQILNKNRSHGNLNPHAHFKELISKTDYFDNVGSNENKAKNPWVARPLTRNDCAGTYNGAAAVVLTPKETDLKLTGIESARGTVSIQDRRTLISLDSTVDAALKLFRQTGIGPNNIGIVELHDAFAPVPIIAAEDLGLASRGKGAEFVLGKSSRYGQKVAYNLSGGFLCKTHPIAASGTAQLVELSLQMRGKEQYGNLEGYDHNTTDFGLWFSMHGFGFYNSAGIVQKTGAEIQKNEDSIGLQERYQVRGKERKDIEKRKLIAVTNLPGSLGDYSGIGAVRIENERLQLGLIKEFNPDYLGRPISSNGDLPSIEFEPITEKGLKQVLWELGGKMRGMMSYRQQS